MSTNYICIVRAFQESKYVYIAVLNDDNTIWGNPDAEAILTTFESKYQEAHRRSYVGSMSACINWMFFNPSVVAVEDIEIIREWVPGKELQAATVSNISGSIKGILLDASKVAAVWDNGIKPKLI